MADSVVNVPADQLYALRGDGLDFIRLQTQLYQAMRATPADELSDVDRQILALLDLNETDDEVWRLKSDA